MQSFDFYCYTKNVKKLFVLLFIIYCLLLSLPGFVFSQDSYATCDLCGYCPPNQPPSNWENCRRCLYETTNSDPFSKETLKINPATKRPLVPAAGRWYTLIGCINTNLGTFQAEGAAASVIQTLLNLVFSVAGGVALLYFLYGSFLVLTSQAEPEKLNQGKRTIYAAIVGIIFCLSSVFIINLLASGVLKIPGFGGSP